MNSKKQNPTYLVSWMTVVPVALMVLLAASPAPAALVAHYTFDDADTVVTGDGTIGNPYQGTMLDTSGNDNTVANTCTQLSPGYAGAPPHRSTAC